MLMLNWMAKPHIQRTNIQTCLNTYAHIETHVYIHMTMPLMKKADIQTFKNT